MYNCNVVEKKCTKCGKTKHPSDFSRDKSIKCGRKSWCKACVAEYYKANREKIVKQHHDWHEANRDKVAERKRKDREANPEKFARQSRRYRENNRDKITKYQREYYETNKDKILEYSRNWCQKNKEKRTKQIKEYKQVNKEKFLEYHRDYKREREAEDIQFRLAARLRTRLGKAIRNEYKSGSAVRDLGCSIAELKEYLEERFEDGMSWDNYGDWHIDHIVPLSSFDLTEREQLLEACHYTNLQPLWAEDNFRKSDNIPDDEGQ